MPENITNIVLNNGSCEMLGSIIGSAGWTSKRREIVAAGNLAERLDEVNQGRPVYKGEVINGNPVDQLLFAKFRAEVRAWERESRILELTDAEFQACTSCVRHYSDEKKIPSNLFGSMLLTAFKLSE